jgi:hypothetical protein
MLNVSEVSDHLEVFLQQQNNYQKMFFVRTYALGERMCMYPNKGIFSMWL